MQFHDATRWKDRKVKVSSAEKKSIPHLASAFDCEFGHLDVGDLLYDHYLIELKLGADIHDYARLADELTRMNYPKYNHLEKHLIYMEPDDTIAFNEYKIAVSVCQRCNVFIHHVKTMQKLVEKCKEIFNGKYNKPLQQHKQSQNIDTLVREIMCFEGISESMAIQLAPVVRKYRWEHLELPKMLKLRWDMYEILGINKDNKPSKLARRYLNWLDHGIDSDADLADEVYLQRVLNAQKEDSV